MSKAEQIRRMQQKKAEILAPIVYVTMDEGDTSAEALDIAMKYSTDQTVCEMVVELVEKMLVLTEGETMNEDPGHEEAEQILQDQQDEYYSGLADSES